MLAKDIMTTNVITVTPDTTVEAVAKLITEKGISGVPVVDGGGSLVGLVSEGDIISRLKNLHIPTYFQLLGGVIYFENPKKLEGDIKKMTAYLVKDLMTSEVFSVGMEAPVEEIATLMAVKKINRVPVVDQNKLVGIISRSDIVRTLIKSGE